MIVRQWRTGSASPHRCLQSTPILGVGFELRLQRGKFCERRIRIGFLAAPFATCFPRARWTVVIASLSPLIAPIGSVAAFRSLAAVASGPPVPTRRAACGGDRDDGAVLLAVPHPPRGPVRQATPLAPACFRLSCRARADGGGAAADLRRDQDARLRRTVAPPWQALRFGGLALRPSPAKRTTPDRSRVPQFG